MKKAVLRELMKKREQKEDVVPNKEEPIEKKENKKTKSVKKGEK